MAWSDAFPQIAPPQPPAGAENSACLAKKGGRGQKSEDELWAFDRSGLAGLVRCSRPMPAPAHRSRPQLPPCGPCSRGLPRVFHHAKTGQTGWSCCVHAASGPLSARTNFTFATLSPEVQPCADPKVIPLLPTIKSLTKPTPLMLHLCKLCLP